MSTRDIIATEDPEEELRIAKNVLAHCGISGIYAEFVDVGDAIDQMAAYIKELLSDEEET